LLRGASENVAGEQECYALMVRFVLWQNFCRANTRATRRS
jgi:hypothetical protein